VHFLRFFHALETSWLPGPVRLAVKRKRRPENGTPLAVLSKSPGTVGPPQDTDLAGAGDGGLSKIIQSQTRRCATVAGSGQRDSTQDNAQDPDRRVRSRPAAHELARRR
jgi:hypothetical protein